MIAFRKIINYVRKRFVMEKGKGVKAADALIKPRG